MKKLNVIYQGWGERLHWGTLADTGKAILFEYTPHAVARGLQLSPLHQPLPQVGSAVVAFKGEAAFQGLPGFIADALPDGWGMLLMDRALRRAGRDPRGVSVLDRLAIVGNRAMGALSFEPAQDGVLPHEVLQLKALAQEVAQELAILQADEAQGAPSDPADTRLRHLLMLGGSPQGARPKVLVDFQPSTGVMSSGASYAVGASPWLVKFPAAGEHKEVAAVEELYARLARSGGLDMPQSRYFDLSAQHSAFGVERFDRQVALRVPVLSLSALVQADFRLPSLDYETLLLATLRITGDQREVLKAFERCVFNVLMHNRDDHSRNFAYRLDAQGLWKLSPAFDLTYSFGPGGEHATSVAGHGKDITRSHLLTLAKQAGLDAQRAQKAIVHWMGVVQTLQEHVMELPIRKSTLQGLIKTTRSLCGAVV